MCPGPPRLPVCLLLLLLHLTVAAVLVLATRPPVHKKNLTVGYLTAVKGAMNERQGSLVSGAITMALEELNANDKVLPGVNLLLRWNDTKGDTVQATRAITEMINDQVTVIFGPEGSCDVESIVSQAWNIPMISYKCSDEKPSKVPTFARTEPPDIQVAKSMITLLRYYNWKKFTILSEDAWSLVVETLSKQAKKFNMTVNKKRTVMGKTACCVKQLDCCNSFYWYKIIQETRNMTRIYVFLGSPNVLIEMMNSMQSQQLFDNGEYVVITVDMMIYSGKESLKFLWTTPERNQYRECPLQNIEKRARSLLVIVSTPPTPTFKKFTDKVDLYNAKEPFNFNTPDLFTFFNFQKYITIYAAYLYDSVYLYANALHTLLKERQNPTDEYIEAVAKNGTLIIDTIIKQRHYESITGSRIKIDDNGDSEGNFSVLALMPTRVTAGNFSCSSHLEPVGTFTVGDGELLEYKVKSIINWVGGDRPEDEPSCGFEHEHCQQDSHYTSMVAAATLGVLLFCAGVITLSIYRKWKIEQEIEGLLWKIDSMDIHGYFGNEIVSSPSKLSLISATSFESRCGPQLFAATAQYRNVRVRIKELKFSKKKDISRDIMKEMRILRDLRHDNINSFIGACLEPMRVLLITDYCAKGSLYDIVENEDIKLDMMFISSLVHDLIKGMLYIHKSVLGFHGNLKSSNCVVTSRWVLQIADFGLHELRHCAESGSIGEHQHYRSLFWKAPELLRDETFVPVRGTPKGDVYSFAIILYEIMGRRGPYGGCGLEPKEIVENVKMHPFNENPFRPDLELLDHADTPCENFIKDCIRECWDENPDQRPDFVTIWTNLRPMKEEGSFWDVLPYPCVRMQGHGRISREHINSGLESLQTSNILFANLLSVDNKEHRNIMDQMMDIMEKYANNLEILVTERTRQLDEEKRKTEDLLNRMLPAPVAERLTKGFGVEPESFDFVTIYFSDIVGFTAMSAESTPLQVVNFLNDLYTLFDRIIKGYDVYKVETIGDAYMVVSGLPLKNGDRHAGEIASMSLDLLEAVKNHMIVHRPNDILKLRIGVHTGPVVAGVVGLTMPRYCLFGDTVNTASRMESNGEPLRIHISTQCKDALEKIGGYIVEERGLVQMKGKGEVKTYWLVGATEHAIQKREVDLGELPPLFCRPRRSPKLNMDSRQASLCGAIGFGSSSRRHSSIPRENSIDVDTSSILRTLAAIGVSNNSSPAANRSQRSSCKRADRSPLYLPDNNCSSKTTLNTCALGSQSESLSLCNECDFPKDSNHKTSLLFSNKMLPSIISTGEGQSSSNTLPRTIRESRSLDPFPDLVSSKLQYLQVPKRSSRSLENCVGCSGKIVPATLFPSECCQMVNNNFPNGNVILMPSQHNETVLGSSAEDIQTPLLRNSIEMDEPIIVRCQLRRGRSGGETVSNFATTKRWRSLEEVPGNNAMSNGGYSKKALARSSIRSWLVGLFNGNGLRSSDASLRKGIHSGYSDLQSERESIV